MPRRLAALLAVLGAGAVLAGCGLGGDDGAGDAAGEAQRRLARAGSLLEDRNFRQALRQLRIATPKDARLTSLRVEARRLDATVVDGEGRRQVLQVDAAFGVVKTDSSTGTTTGGGIPPREIQPRALGRMLSALRERQGTRPADVDYVVLGVSPIDGEVSWNAFLRTGAAQDRQFTAAGDGTDVRRLGEPSREQREAIRRNAALQRRVQRRVRCLQRATTAADVQRCPAA